MLRPLFFVLVDIIGGMITPGYSYVAHAVSELTRALSIHSRARLTRMDAEWVQKWKARMGVK